MYKGLKKVYLIVLERSGSLRLRLRTNWNIAYFNFNIHLHSSRTIIDSKCQQKLKDAYKIINSDPWLIYLFFSKDIVGLYSAIFNSWETLGKTTGA